MARVHRSWRLPASGIAMFFFLKSRDAADSMAARFAGLHRLLANKYLVDEIYDAADRAADAHRLGGGLVEGRGRAASSTAR